MRYQILLVIAVCGLLGATPARAEDAPAVTDLKATIALHGMPCDQVIDVKRNGDSDYIASCKDGNRYHVAVNAQGRVIVEKQ